MLGECAGECPCCRPAYQNDPIDQLTGTGSQTSGWGPGWGWGPLRPPPPRPPGRPVPYGRPPQPGRPVSSNRPPPASSGGVVYNGGGGPAMGGPYYSHFGGRYSHFRTGGLADEEFEEEAEMEGTDKRGDAESIEIEGKVKMEETDENSKTENREKHNMEVAMKKTEEKDKSDDVKLGFAPSFGAGWAGGACFCTSVYKPICGSNNVTYTNMCEFRCASRKNTCKYPNISLKSITETVNYMNFQKRDFLKQVWQKLVKENAHAVLAPEL